MIPLPVHTSKGQHGSIKKQCDPALKHESYVLGIKHQAQVLPSSACSPSQMSSTISPEHWYQKYKPRHPNIEAVISKHQPGQVWSLGKCAMKGRQRLKLLGQCDSVFHGISTTFATKELNETNQKHAKWNSMYHSRHFTVFHGIFTGFSRQDWTNNKHSKHIHCSTITRWYTKALIWTPEQQPLHTEFRYMRGMPWPWG